MSAVAIAAVFTEVRALPEQGPAAVLGGPPYDQLLLPVHVLPGQTVAASAQDPRHIEWLVQ